MRIRFCLPLVILAGMLPLRAQDDGPVKMTPDFPLAFPIAQNGHDVTVKYPVLINPATVLKPGMILRVLYILTDNQNDGSSDLVLAHSDDAAQAYSRASNSADGGGGPQKLPPGIAHEIEGYRRTIWDVPNNFVLAMAQFPTDSMHLIYSTTGGDRDKDLADERFSFFDGLFVGLPNGNVTVLAVETDSKADRAGLKAGDVILSIGGIPTRNDLSAFASAYATAKHNAKEDELATYPVAIRSHDGGTRTVNVPMPARIQSSLMDGFK